MARRKSSKKRKYNKEEDKEDSKKSNLHPETKNSIFAISALGVSTILLLSAFDKAGPAGEFIFNLLQQLLGWGYYLIPFILIIGGLNILTNFKRAVIGPTLIGAGIFILSSLGFLDIIMPEKAGLLGTALGSLESLFGYWASIVVNITILIVAIVMTINIPLKLKVPGKKKKEDEATGENSEKEPKVIIPGVPDDEVLKMEKAEEPSNKKSKDEKGSLTISEDEVVLNSKNYVFPPLKLLKSTTEKPVVGDLRANASTIKRTLEGFGIPVEMGEITIGPKVTRYTLKPAEGVKLSRLMALNQDLSLALAAHPIRIEAPIPGKSLVGIEIPNKKGTIVRLGALLKYPDFNKSGHLGIPLGRDVAGEPLFISIAKMPHVLIAGATGSGKSVTIHAILLSLLFKNSPETLRLILIDPKRVELSPYNGIPHLITPVIVDGKKAISALRYGIKEMEERYETLLQAGVRDIASYNKGRKEDIMPYLVIVIDELADLMTTYGREVEGAIVRLAQMARATGIHLVVSTQRPSVEVITGLIKANIPARVALQVASQIDSRTILDSAGAEKLLGGGDMLFVSSDISKPIRIQGSFVTDEEINSVVAFIKKHNPPATTDTNLEDNKEDSSELDGFMDNDVDDDMYDEALEVVRNAQKASASLLQRRLRVGYARAARLLDIMEDKGLIGPSDGAKAREVFIPKEDGVEEI